MQSGPLPFASSFGTSFGPSLGLKRDEKGRVDTSEAPFEWVIGVDEVGRGCLAGPVVAGAVVLKNRQDLEKFVDSKSISEKSRNLLAKKIHEDHFVGLGSATSEEVDELNILQASFLAMVRALVQLSEVCAQSQASPKFSSIDWNKALVLVDGHLKIPLPWIQDLHRQSGQNLKGAEPSANLDGPAEGNRHIPGVASQILHQSPAQLAVVKGDQLVPEISAASIAAKVHRDQWMQNRAQEFPHYEWQKNKGYGSVAHRRALEKYGPSPLHRRSFAWKGVQDEV